MEDLKIYYKTGKAGKNRSIDADLDRKAENLARAFGLTLYNQGLDVANGIRHLYYKKEE
jgi:hypothetical protein